MTDAPRFTLYLAIATATIAAATTAQVPWRHVTSGSGQIPAPQGAVQQTTCLTADFNRDGVDDMLVASRNFGGRVQAWLSQSGGGWNRVDIDSTNAQTEAGGAIHDIDGDGDPDVVIGQDFAGSDIYWWENPNPNFSANWTRRVIKTGGGTKHHDQAFGDFDGDGSAELAAWNQNANQLLLFEIPANPRTTTQPWSSRVIFTSPNDQYEGLAVGDVDLDGVVDIVGAGRWWKHTGGGSYQTNIVDAAMFFTRSAVGQLIPGGRPEIIYLPGDASGNGYWYEWNGSSWVSHLIGFIYHGHTLDIADVDGDNAMDIFVGEMKLGSANCRVRVLYGDNAGNFTEQVLATGNGIHEGRLADLDGDGDLDIAHKPYNDGTPRLEIWFNDRQSLPVDRWQRHLVDGALPYRAIFVGTGDYDNDGHTDIAAGGWWWKNPGTVAGTWTRRDIHVGGYLNYGTSFDVDGDGDTDLLGTRAPGDQASSNFAWAENRGVQGLQVHTNIQGAQGNFLQGIKMQRFTGPTGAKEVALSWHDSSVGIQMLTVPANPTVNTWSWRRIQTTSQGEDLSSGDIDGDGDLDLMLGTIWLENPSWTAHTIGIVSDFTGFGGTPEPDRNRMFDVNGDGDLDVVIGLENGREIVYFENPRPAGNPRATWQRNVLGAFNGQGFSMDIGDFDRDGDQDVIMGEHKGLSTNRVILLQNNGTNSNWPTVVVDDQSINTIDHHNGTIAVDLDNDGDLDVISIGWFNPKLWIFENRALTGGGGNPQTAQPPTVDMRGSVFHVGRVVTMTPAFLGQEVRYTTNGTDPTQSSPRYNSPLALFDTTRIKARSFEPNKLPSDIITTDFARLPQPLSLWSFDEGSGATALDSGTRGFHGTITGANWTSGLISGALDFDPTGTRVTLGNFDLPQTQVTLSAWIQGDNYTHLSGGDARVLSKSVSTNEQDHVFMLSTIASGADIRPRLRLKVNGLTRTLIASSGNIPPNTWAHVAAVYDGQDMLLYLNGQEVGRLSAAGTIDQNNAVPVWIGDNPVGGTRPFDGRIDEVRIDGIALSPAQIGALARELPLRGVSLYGSASPSCVGAVGIEALREAKANVRFFGFAAWNPVPGFPGFLVLGAAPATPGLFIDQAALWVSPAAGVFYVFPMSSDALGRAVQPMAIPWVPRGSSFYAQAFWLNHPNCHAASGLFAGTEAIRVVTQ